MKMLTHMALEQMADDDLLGLAMAIAPGRVVDDVPASRDEYIAIILDEQRPEMPDYTDPAIRRQRISARFPL